MIVKKQRPTWPKTLWILGIILVSIGIILFTAGMITSIILTNNGYTNNNIKIGVILTFISIFLFALEGVPMLIVGAIFDHRYNNIYAQK